MVMISVGFRFLRFNVEVDSLVLHDSNVGISQSGTANVIFHSVEFSGTNGIGIDWSSVSGADISMLL